MKSDKLTFGILGGDKRNYYLAKALKNDGYEVKLCGFEKLSNMSCEVSSALDSDVIVLPIIPFDKGKEVKSPYAEKTVDLSGYEDKLKGKKVFTGKREKFLSEFSGMEKETLSYSDREEFSVKNAVPTAEGAIEKAINRNDIVSINHRISALMASYFDIIFAVNELLHPGEKRLVKYAKDNCQILPNNFEENINKLLVQPNSETLNILDDMVESLRQILYLGYHI